ncbi:hypothetical protein [Archangium primigenium]|uniref:hypothetical protein n=1 Tax=[Archangium] primigenium TaxID=2792470 RepID=UPI00195D8075|nr:hypothetical protein [Archangium primigenium]MBM7112235.1 hypothetical protein [Archangium primigenium]
MTSRKRGGWVLLAVVVLVLVGVALLRPRPDASVPPTGTEARPDAAPGAPVAKAPPGTPPKAPPPAAPAGAKPSAPAAPGREVIAELGWGSGPDQLGRDRPQEANPEGPMSLAVTPLGDILVMDQLNGRLLRLGQDGKVLGSTPLTQQVPQDVTVAQDGSMLVLDRLRDKTVAILDPLTGTLKGELPLQGKHLPETGLITGTFVDGDQVYVEREHGTLVNIGSLSGQANPEQPELNGRPTRDGRSLIVANIVEARAGRVLVNSIDRASNSRRFTRQYPLGFPILFLTLLDSDRSGVIYLGVAGELPTGRASPATAEGVRLFCLDPLEGKVLGQVDLPLSPMPEETFRDFAVLDEGGVIYKQMTETGVTLRRADCR